MSFKSFSTLNSKIQLEIASTYTDVPGTQSFTFDPGENGTYDDSDLSSTYDDLAPTGVGGGGSLSGSKLWDPLDPVDQFCQARQNAGGGAANGASTVGVGGKAHMGSTGVVWDFDGIVTKWTPKIEKKSGGMVDFEFKLARRPVMNEADPA